MNEETAMPYDTPTPAANPGGRRVLLSRRQTLVIQDGQGTVIAVDRGCLWITMENDPRDILLVPGMRFEIDRGGRTVIAAEEDSRLCVQEEHAPHRLDAWLASIAQRIEKSWT